MRPQLAQVQDIGDTFTRLLDSVLQAIPQILVFLLILLIGYIVARILRRAVEGLLGRIGLDQTLHNNEYGQYAERVSPGASPTRLIGALVLFFVLLGALSIAVSYTANPGLTAFFAEIYSYIPKVVAALLIFVVAGAVAGAVGGLVQRTMGDTGTGKVVQAVVPPLVLGIALFMILDQLDIAPEIVPIGFTILFGGVVLALALAFGIGGREVAGEIVREAYQRGQQQREQLRRDVEVGRERGREDAERAKQRAQREHQARAGGGGGGQPGGGQGGGPQRGGDASQT